VAEAVKILGRNFTLDGEVVHGEGRGRELGFPTANLITQKEILPRDGVYAVKVKWRNQYFDGVINIGCRPTFAADAPTLEIHLMDFQGDLYGERLRIYFVERLRDELRFPTVAALKDAVAEDIVEYREYLDCGYRCEQAGEQ
jgi:riboflavin kinase/FMN adenylyltransferase